MIALKKTNGVLGQGGVTVSASMITQLTKPPEASTARGGTMGSQDEETR